MTGNLIRIVNESNNPLPKYATEGSSGLDLRANLVCKDGSKGIEYKGVGFNITYIGDNAHIRIDLLPNGRVLIPTGLHLDIPRGYEGQIRPRSGLALKYGITVLNTPGTIDSDYKGDVGIILYNLSDKPFTINHGDRIAQLVITSIKKVILKEIDASIYEDSDRGKGGFGHTGKE